MAMDSVKITVNALPSVTLTAGSNTVCVNGPTVALTGSPLGGVYTGSNVSGSMFTPPSTSGTFNPVYSVTNATTGCSNSATTTIIVSICTGLNKNSVTSEGLHVYPNPNTGQFTVEFNNGEVKTIEITDVTGRIILSEVSSNDKVNVDISNYANGVYIVKLISNNSAEIVRIIKQ